MNRWLANLGDGFCYIAAVVYVFGKMAIRYLLLILACVMVYAIVCELLSQGV